VGARYPSGDLDGGPLVLGATEGDEHGPLRAGADVRTAAEHRKRDVARHVRQHQCEIYRRRAVLDETGRRVEQQQIGLLLGAEQHQILARGRGSEGGHAGRDATCREPAPQRFEPV
jgi:hypothetical protein